MQDATLQRIGRRHSVAEVKDAFRLARECGFDNINMDLIIGLPGETVADFGDTLRQVEELEPDSVTIHSLVIKRASKLRELLDASEEGLSLERAERMEQMFAMGQSFARQHGYNPYYMYRQKNSAGYGGSTGQENIGFAKAGKECLYNILIMEEMQSILAVGAGASTKYYDKEKKTVSRVENVKSVTDYINRIDEMLERKRV
jgi:oxygen-independent coproporphyrinogen-3 oxidase